MDQLCAAAQGIYAEAARIAEHVEHAAAFGIMFEDVLDLVNQEREKAGLQPLQLDEELNGYAERRAQEVTRYFSHQRPDGSDFNTLVPDEQARKYACLGENLQRGANSPVTVVANWMLSPTHKANILYPDYNVMGLAYVYQADDDSHHYWVQWFGKR